MIFYLLNIKNLNRKNKQRKLRELQMNFFLLKMKLK
jgi:hypothetical protein